MPERNIFTEAALEMLAEAREIQKESQKRPATPFMMEETTAALARQKFMEMSDEERKAYIEQVGQDNVLRLFRGKPQRRA